MIDYTFKTNYFKVCLHQVDDLHGITLLTHNSRVTFRAVCDKSIGLGKATMIHDIALSNLEPGCAGSKPLRGSK